MDPLGIGHFNHCPGCYCGAFAYLKAKREATP